MENYLAVKLLLLLGVRKQELTVARVEEFDLLNTVWHLPGARTKTGAPIDIPLPLPALDALRRLLELNCGDDYLLPARKQQDRMLPHIHENTLNVALSKVKPLLSDIENFTIHDFRRTMRTHLAALGISPHVGELCLNHKVRGIEGIYNRHAFFDERRAALEKWAAFVDACEAGEGWNIVPMRRSSSEAC